MNAWQLVVVIVVINIIYVSLSTIRFIFVMKGQRVLAGGLSMIEVFVYIIGLDIALKNIGQPINLAAYCVGWGIGVYLGSRIEEWLALGYVTVQIVVDNEQSTLPNQLRDKGYGVTSWIAEGRDGPRLTMLVLAKRSNEKKLLHLLGNIAPRAFVVSHDPKTFRGGFWVKRILS